MARKKAATKSERGSSSHRASRTKKRATPKSQTEKSKTARKRESSESTSSTKSNKAAVVHEPARSAPGTASDKAAGFTERLLTCLPSPHPELDWRIMDDASLSLPGDEDLPASVDLREPWWPVNDQGITGSCVGWALADSILRWHFVKTQRLAPDKLLSARFVWMASKETDEFTSRPESFIEDAGTSLKAALDVARNWGCVTSDMLPFDPGRLYSGTTKAFYMAASRFRVNMYVRVNSIREWKQWLAARGPILIRVEVDRAWLDCPDGRLEFYDPVSGGIGGHAAAVVGYTAQGDFIIRNSWGTRWGDGGFALATPLYVDKAVSEAFGVFV